MREVPFARPIIGQAEKDAVWEVLDSGYLVHGPKIREFEAAFRSFTGSPYAVGVSSCTAGLHLAYYALGIGAGDEVIVPALTHAATAHAVEYVGARPVFVDAEARTGNIDLDLVEEAITDRTRALSVVHYLGMPVDMDRVMSIADEHDLFVIEDCALSVGSSYDNVHTGLHGTCGVFSFYPVKHFTTGEGGMVITRDQTLAERVAHLRAFGVDRDYGRRKLPGKYQVTDVGFNYRMSELHAALGVVQLGRLPGFIEARERNFGILDMALRDLECVSIFESTNARHRSNYYCHVARLDGDAAGRQEELISELNGRGVGTSVYYPGPLPCMAYYREKYDYTAADFPVADSVSNGSIALPVGPHLDEDDIQYIVQEVKEVLCQ